jgi:predicted metal-binding membrane protein
MRTPPTPKRRSRPLRVESSDVRWSIERQLYIVSLVVFAIAALATGYFLASMSRGMPMPGHWTMSMTWMVMPEQTWLTAALVFVSMWLAMMIVMMLPSVLPLMLVYRRAAALTDQPHVQRSLWLLASAYFVVWTMFGVVAYAAAMVIAHAAMKWAWVSRAIPVAAACALLVAGCYQLTTWKSVCLKHCRDPLALVARYVGDGPVGAVRLGLHHGAMCAGCCWSLMLVQLVLGIMNVGVIGVAAVIALEKLLARGELVARFAGVATIVGGLVMLLLASLP